MNGMADLVERALVGSLLLAPDATRARQVRGLFEPDDLADARLRVVVELVDSCLAAGAAPDPAAVFGVARSAGVVPGSRLGDLGRLLTELVAQVAVPASAPLYAAQVVEASVRRRMRESGQRLLQAAESKDLDTAIGVAVGECRALTDVAERVHGKAVAADD